MYFIAGLVLAKDQETNRILVVASSMYLKAEFQKIGRLTEDDSNDVVGLKERAANDYCILSVFSFTRAS